MSMGSGQVNVEAILTTIPDDFVAGITIPNALLDAIPCAEGAIVLEPRLTFRGSVNGKSSENRIEACFARIAASLICKEVALFCHIELATEVRFKFDSDQILPPNKSKIKLAANLRAIWENTPVC
ncbi:hypothetical protein AVEN_247332-1 [Araneus ventricosus]|uniref:Uncharacterized protein n=1 Tax=Araneus ventricosus TaxID=182803 RepID=A0A4Y2QCX2_ARAVE|nr:hypothetical protein AVEN_247332-1 [Araneus ventricosus]